MWPRLTVVLRGSTPPEPRAAPRWGFGAESITSGPVRFRLGWAAEWVEGEGPSPPSRTSGHVASRAAGGPLLPFGYRAGSRSQRIKAAVRASRRVSVIARGRSADKADTESWHPKKGHAPRRRLPGGVAVLKSDAETPNLLNASYRGADIIKRRMENMAALAPLPEWTRRRISHKIGKKFQAAFTSYD